MQPQDVVLLQCNSRVEQSLVSALSKSFRSIHHVSSFDELCSSISKHRASIAILDIEKASLSEVERLSHDFPTAAIVCTHRCADEEMWTAALNAGASDLVSSDDTRSIVQAALRSGGAAQLAAA
jgi:DNA-binding NarL/FixJ family response regulator